MGNLPFIERPHGQIMEDKCNSENYFIDGILMTMFDIYLKGVSQHIYSVCESQRGRAPIADSPAFSPREGHEGLKRMSLWKWQCQNGK